MSFGLSLSAAIDLTTQGVFRLLPPSPRILTCSSIGNKVFHHRRKNRIQTAGIVQMDLQNDTTLPLFNLERCVCTKVQRGFA